MKARVLFTLALIPLSATIYPLNADHIKFELLPTAVQQTINRSKGNDTLGEIDRETRDGKTVYEVEFPRDGANPKLVIAENGTIVEDQRASRGTTAASQPGIALGDLPEPVRRTIHEESRGRTIADIDLETWDGQQVYGQQVYEVEFEQPGRNAQIHVLQNGSLVRDERVGTGVAGLFPGTQLEDLPLAAQKTIKDQAGSGKIKDIDKETRDGQTVYEVQLDKAGQDINLYVDAAGKVVNASDLAAGAPSAQVRIGPRARKR